MTLTVITQVTQLQPPILNSDDSYNHCRAEVAGSGTANEIFAELEQSPFEVGVLFIDREVDSMYIPPFQLTGQDAHSGGVAVVNVESPMNISGKRIPLGVSLIHELGHAVQYLNKPEWFKNLYLQAISGTDDAKREIEDQNIHDHEGPVCQELALPYRKEYD